MYDQHAIETMLGDRPGQRPSPDLRQRVLAGVAAELEGHPEPRFWRTLAVSAAAALVWMHLSWSASLQLRLPAAHTDAREVADLADQIQRLVPEWSAADARRQALVMISSEQLPLVQQPMHAGPGRGASGL